MTALALLLALLAAAPAAAEGWTPPPAKKGFEYPECYCTNRGEKVPMGKTAYLEVGGRTFLARCGMSLNNPTWRPTGEACPPAPGASLRVEGVEPG